MKLWLWAAIGIAIIACDILFVKKSDYYGTIGCIGFVWTCSAPFIAHFILSKRNKSA